MRISDHKHWQSIKKIIPSGLFDFMYHYHLQRRSYKYKGNEVFCPICESKHKSFTSNSCCPSCDASVRHRTVWLFLQRKTNFFTDQFKFLHFAPEFCFVKKFKKVPNIDYLSADFNAPRAMEKMDMMHIPYPDNHFDISLSIDVLDDIPDDFKAIAELYKVQKSDGWSIHLSPVIDSLEVTLEDPEITKDPKKRLEYYGGYANLRRYGMDYKDRLASSGFTVEVYMTDDFCTQDEIENMGLLREFI